MRILVVDDDELSRGVVTQVITGILGYEVVESSNGNEALDKYLEDPFPIVITDIRMPGMNGLDLLKNIKNSPTGDNTEVILITGFADLDMAIKAIRNGATDFLRKPLHASVLLELISNLAHEVSIKKSSTKISDIDNISAPLSHKIKNTFELPDGSKLALFSNKLKNLSEMALRLHEDQSIHILIDGETGTGKELFSKLIHYGGNQNNSPFIPVNCSAISQSLIESELFGYEKGSFTGALKTGMKGKIEAAHGGTLFLDEVGEIPLSLQPKLLRALQEHKICRIGSVKEVKVDFRVIAATNQNLEKMVEEGTFRRDLYFRLKVGHLSLPPLRKQKKMIAPLAQMFLMDYSHKKERSFKGIARQTVSVLESHSWPGNVRELKSVIEQAVILFDDLELLPEHISVVHFKPGSEKNDNGMIEEPVKFRLPDEGLDLRELNTEIVRKVMDMFDGNKSKTAKYLGLSLSALRSRINQLEKS